MTVKCRFFTQPGSGPVLQPARGHRDLALSCIMYYLHFGLPLLDSGVSTEEQVIEVVKGYHGLQPYAHEYLIEHLSMVGRYRDALSPSDLQKLMISFDQLCSNVDTVRTSLGLPMSPQDRVGTTIPAGLVYLGENQAMRDFILEELSNRENIRQTLETGPSRTFTFLFLTFCNSGRANMTTPHISFRDANQVNCFWKDIRSA